MRRLLVLAAAGLALLGAACGSDSDGDNASNTDSNDDNSGAAAVAANVATVCGGREAVDAGASGASAQQSSSVDYDALVENLRKAADAAPEEIEDDFEVVVEAQIPFFEALARANGNYMAVASDPEFQAAAEKMNTEEVQTAAQNITDWYAENCS